MKRSTGTPKSHVTWPTAVSLERHSTPFLLVFIGRGRIILDHPSHLPTGPKGMTKTSWPPRIRRPPCKGPTFHGPSSLSPPSHFPSPFSFRGPPVIIFNGLKCFLFLIPKHDFPSFATNHTLPNPLVFIFRPIKPAGRVRWPPPPRLRPTVPFRVYLKRPRLGFYLQYQRRTRRFGLFRRLCLCCRPRSYQIFQTWGTHSLPLWLPHSQPVRVHTLPPRLAATRPIRTRTTRVRYGRQLVLFSPVPSHTSFTLVELPPASQVARPHLWSIAQLLFESLREG